MVQSQKDDSAVSRLRDFVCVLKPDTTVGASIRIQTKNSR